MADEGDFKTKGLAYEKKISDPPFSSVWSFGRNKESRDLTATGGGGGGGGGSSGIVGRTREILSEAEYQNSKHPFSFGAQQGTMGHGGPQNTDGGIQRPGSNTSTSCGIRPARPIHHAPTPPRATQHSHGSPAYAHAPRGPPPPAEEVRVVVYERSEMIAMTRNYEALPGVSTHPQIFTAALKPEILRPADQVLVMTDINSPHYMKQLARSHAHGSQEEIAGRGAGGTYRGRGRGRGAVIGEGRGRPSPFRGGSDSAGIGDGREGSAERTFAWKRRGDLDDTISSAEGFLTGHFEDGRFECDDEPKRPRGRQRAETEDPSALMGGSPPSDNGPWAVPDVVVPRKSSDGVFWDNTPPMVQPSPPSAASSPVPVPSPPPEEPLECPPKPESPSLPPLPAPLEPPNDLPALRRVDQRASLLGAGLWDATPPAAAGHHGEPPSGDWTNNGTWGAQESPTPFDFPVGDASKLDDLSSMGDIMSALMPGRTSDNAISAGHVRRSYESEDVSSLLRHFSAAAAVESHRQTTPGPSRMGPPGIGRPVHTIHPIFGAGTIAVPITNPNEDIWQYRDAAGEIHGRFSSRRMLEWYKKGMLPDRLPIRYSQSLPFMELCELFPPSESARFPPFQCLPRPLMPGAFQRMVASTSTDPILPPPQGPPPLASRMMAVPRSVAWPHHQHPLSAADTSMLQHPSVIAAASQNPSHHPPPHTIPMIPTVPPPAPTESSTFPDFWDHGPPVSPPVQVPPNAKQFDDMTPSRRAAQMTVGLKSLLGVGLRSREFQQPHPTAMPSSHRTENPPMSETFLDHHGSYGALPQGMQRMSSEDLSGGVGSQRGWMPKGTTSSPEPLSRIMEAQEQASRAAADVARRSFDEKVAHEYLMTGGDRRNPKWAPRARPPNGPTIASTEPAMPPSLPTSDFPMIGQDGNITKPQQPAPISPPPSTTGTRRDDHRASLTKVPGWQTIAAPPSHHHHVGGAGAPLSKDADFPALTHLSARSTDKDTRRTEADDSGEAEVTSFSVEMPGSVASYTGAPQPKYQQRPPSGRIAAGRPVDEQWTTVPGRGRGNGGGAALAKSKSPGSTTAVTSPAAKKKGKAVDPSLLGFNDQN